MKDVPMICRPRTSTIALSFTLALLTLPVGPALAQTDPKFEFAKPEAVKTVEWKDDVPRALAWSLDAHLRRRCGGR